MLEYLNKIDTDLFIFLNSHHNSFWDSIMTQVSGRMLWLPLYFIIAAVIIVKYGKKSWIYFAALILLIIISDQLASGFIKPLVCRLRPSQNPLLEPLVHIVNDYKGGLYGFVSSHAANTFALAVFSALLFKNKAYMWFIFSWASIVSYSRIYLGVHYPGDVLGGIIIGVLSAWLVYYFLNKIVKKQLVMSNEQ